MFMPGVRDSVFSCASFVFSAPYLFFVVLRLFPPRSQATVTPFFYERTSDRAPPSAIQDRFLFFSLLPPRRFPHSRGSTTLDCPSILPPARLCGYTGFLSHLPPNLFFA